MKRSTAVKIIRRYIRGLSNMEAEARMQGESADEEHYRIDRIAMQMALESLEKEDK